MKRLKLDFHEKRRSFHIIRFRDNKGVEKAVACRKDPRGRLKEGQRYGGKILARDIENANFLLAYNVDCAIRKGWPLSLDEVKERKSNESQPRKNS